MFRSKRTLPTRETLDWREKYLQKLGQLTTSYPTSGVPPGLSPGNSKVGFTGTKYEVGFVWNLPAIATCPGASDWCKRVCYNADPRTEKFPVEEWLENWRWAAFYPDQLQERIEDQLAKEKGKIAVRIHSSGDFFSNQYIDLWNKIIKRFSHVDFWAYTRSWAIADLLPDLQRLKGNCNLQLFASVDESQKSAPDNWRKSHVVDSLPDETWLDGALNCPEQNGKVKNCLSCGYCMSRSDGDVVFVIH